MQDENMIIDTESEKKDSLNSGLENESRLNIGKEIDIANNLLIEAKFIFGDDDLQYSKILQAKTQLEKLLARLAEDKIKAERYREKCQRERGLKQKTK